MRLLKLSSFATACEFGGPKPQIGQSQSRFTRIPVSLRFEESSDGHSFYDDFCVTMFLKIK